MPKKTQSSKKDAGEAKRGRGRPPREGEPTCQAALLLDQSVSDWLEEQVFLLWKSSHQKVSRSEIVRGILKGIKDSGVDLTKHPGEDLLRDLVLKKMRR
jgi:hypothetical protein